ncbi:APC family permease [Cellulomonas soli]|uniref:APC family permease n=1 Tax=Cellulomonas soli TaxID=931535 RepID=UPI003F83F61A
MSAAPPDGSASRPGGSAPPPDAPATPPGGALVRRLGLADAIVIGLSSMLGAGVFVVFAPAARAAGTGLLLALVLTAVVAYANAMSTAQLAAAYPTSGGAYTFGRERLGPVWGFVAGWGFVTGKVASCAVMATTVSLVLVPAAWQRPVAAAVVVLLVAVNLRGVTRTVAVARVLLVGVLLVLGALVVAGGRGADAGRLELGTSTDAGLIGIAQAAALLFFAFAGYARVASLGEEVRDPRRTIPRAVAASLAGAVVIYALVAVTALAVLGPDGLAASVVPLVDVAEQTAPALVPFVRVAAVAASLGALLALLAGLGRTALAMARGGDLPAALTAVDARHSVPARAEVALGLVVVALVLTVDLTGVLGFSSFGVLVYYAVANAAALTQTGTDRTTPRALQVLGLVGCLGLVASLPPAVVLAGVGVVAVGLLGRIVVGRTRNRRSDA